MLTLDADDALTGRHVLDMVRSEYDDGAASPLARCLCWTRKLTTLSISRNHGHGNSNVWQHLRTFRKFLFDAIDVEDLKLDGEWIDLANDWAFMVPMAEIARSPRHIPEPLYIYEPAEAKQQVDRQQRNSVIARILAKPRHARLEWRDQPTDG